MCVWGGVYSGKSLLTSQGFMLESITHDKAGPSGKTVTPQPALQCVSPPEPWFGLMHPSSRASCVMWTLLLLWRMK